MQFIKPSVVETKGMKKNILMLTALFAFAQSSIADNVYSIYLESPELVAGDTIAIEHLDMILETVRSVSRSVAVEDGHVLIKDTITEFSELTLKCLGKTSDGLTIYVEPGQQSTVRPMQIVGQQQPAVFWFPLPDYISGQESDLS